MSTGFVCKKCFDEGFDFGPKAVQVACSCEAGDRWLERRQAPTKPVPQNGWVVPPLPEYKPSDKAGVNEKGRVWRFYGSGNSQWRDRNDTDAADQFWVRNDKGRYGVWNCVAHTKPGDLVNDDDNPCLLWAVAPFDPDRPDLDPPEVRQ